MDVCRCGLKQEPRDGFVEEVDDVRVLPEMRVDDSILMNIAQNSSSDSPRVLVICHFAEPHSHSTDGQEQ